MYKAFCIFCLTLIWPGGALSTYSVFLTKKCRVNFQKPPCNLKFNYNAFFGIFDIFCICRRIWVILINLTKGRHNLRGASLVILDPGQIRVKSLLCPSVFLISLEINSRSLRSLAPRVISDDLSDHIEVSDALI